MRRALLVIDYQYDFVADDGKLTVGKPAQAIESVIKRIADQFEEDDIFFTFDNHSESDWQTNIFPETKAFPTHCVKGMRGYELYGGIKGSRNKKNHILKHAYCPDFDVLEQLTQAYDEITIAGVVTDICVFQTVIGLYTAAVNAGKKLDIVVAAEACASFNPERERLALEYMRDVLSVEITGVARG